MDDEGYEASGGGGVGAAVGDFWAGEDVEGEEEDDVGGEEDGEEGVVDGVRHEGAEAEEDGEPG